MAELKRKLTLFDLTMIAIGSTIGSGIFFTPSLIANTLQTPFLILAVWFIGGLMALSGALTFAELSSLFPKAGGVYVYLKESYGELVGFLYGWAYFWVVNTGAIAAVAVAFSTYFGFFVPRSVALLKLTAIVGIIIVTIINVLGVKAGGIFSDIFTVLKLIGIAGLIITGLFFGSPHLSNYSTRLVSDNSLSHLFAIAMVGVLWSYGGWHHATFTSSEAVNPKKDMPRAITFAAIVITAIYILINVAYMFLLTPKQIGASHTVAADAVITVLVQLADL
jgi:basic amino acid/polyamine antiporter, APA family